MVMMEKNGKGESETVMECNVDRRCDRTATAKADTRMEKVLDVIDGE